MERVNKTLYVLLVFAGKLFQKTIVICCVNLKFSYIMALEFNSKVYVCVKIMIFVFILKRSMQSTGVSNDNIPNNL